MTLFYLDFVLIICCIKIVHVVVYYGTKDIMRSGNKLSRKKPRWGLQKISLEFYGHH